MNEDKKLYTGGAEQISNVKIELDGFKYVGQQRSWKKVVDIDLETRKEYNRQGKIVNAQEEVTDPAVIDKLQEKWNSLLDPAKREDLN